MLSRALLICIVLSTTAAGASSQLSIFTWDEGTMPRHAYVRSEPTVIRVRLSPSPSRAVSGKVSLMLEDRILTTRRYRISPGTDKNTETRFTWDLSDFKSAKYVLRASCDAEQGLSTQCPLWLCPPPDNEGLMMAIWWENAYKKKGSQELVPKLRKMGMTAIQVMYVYPQLLDDCLWNRMSCISISQGNARSAGFTPDKDEMLHIDAAGKVAGKRSITSLDWQRATARDLERRIRAMSDHPAYYPRICTSDDYFTRTGPDYNPRNVQRFTDIYGVAPPHPDVDGGTNSYSTTARRKGIIPDNDPWVLWQKFTSLDVLGHYNRLLADAVLAATDGQGKIGPVSGGGKGFWGFMPYADITTGQWPTHNFGRNGFNLLCCYNYNFYHHPALAQVWWYELGRMGNRDVEQWLMPETMDKRITAHLQNWYLYMAASQQGLAYFTYERSTPAALEAFKRIAPVARNYRRLFTALQPVDRTVGILTPFENSCFNSRHVEDLSYVFCNLAMAHVEAEPVAPSELSSASPYKAILLHNIDWLTRTSLAQIEEFQSQGGTVIMDSLCEVSIPGAITLSFALTDADRRSSYGNVEQIATVKRAIEQYVQPWARSDDPHLLIRRVRLGNTDYLWLVDLMTHDEDLDHVAPAEEQREAELLPKYVGTDTAERIVTLSVPNVQYHVYDVFRGTRIKTATVDGRLQLHVALKRWQGALLALYPKPPTRLKIKAPDKVRQGREASVRIRILAGRRRHRASFPVSIELTDPDGRINSEYSHRALAARGEHRFTIPFALNDPPGQWRICAKELSTGLQDTILLTVRPQ